MGDSSLESQVELTEKMDETIKSETDTLCSTDMSQPQITEVHFEQDLPSKLMTKIQL